MSTRRNCGAPAAAGKSKITRTYDVADDFSDGLAPVQVGNRWGYINKEGKVAINPQFNDARGFSLGLAPV